MTSTNRNRRSFFKKTAVAAVAAPLVTSLEEYALTAQEAQPASPPRPAPSSKATLPTGSIGKVKMSRLICGGNLISGYAHSRDLIYVSKLLKNYFTEDKIMETWSVCEQHGINTAIFNPRDKQAVEIYKKYRARGGAIQLLAQLAPDKKEISRYVQEAVDMGAVGALLVGNYGDAWTRDGEVDKIGEFVSITKAQGLIAGVGGHELRTPTMVEKAGINPDFYMKTLHSNNYWSQRRPDQMKEVIDNYGIDNYWCRDPKETVQYMATVERPWIAYKVLAAGAIQPKSGFQFAFSSGADFAAVGMFDFQVAEDVAAANQVLGGKLDREREWMA
jgi:hypothetical protein